MTNTTEWIELTDLKAVALAQAEGWEIAWKAPEDIMWCPWKETAWVKYNQYRGRPRQPAMKEVKMECWLIDGELTWLFPSATVIADTRIRQPHLDMIAQVPKCAEDKNTWHTRPGFCDHKGT